MRKAPMKIFSRRRKNYEEEGNGQNKKKIHNFYSAINIFILPQLRRMRCEGYVSCMDK
jgi:hypothetical protein